MATIDYVFFDVDGTALYEKPEQDRYAVFLKAASYILYVSTLLDISMI